ncbi:hypothetical protein [Chlorogloeopsis sp. ULAP02]|uniref:hypothetical protein n=1 Tax=Chlorogloeopsis sp. ULAP02 TaxID=3107926 RepID=UPI003134DBA0
MTLKTTCKSVNCLIADILQFIFLKVNQTKSADNGFLALGDNVETRSQLHVRIQTLHGATTSFASLQYIYVLLE